MFPKWLTSEEQTSQIHKNDLTQLMSAVAWHRASTTMALDLVAEQAAFLTGRVEATTPEELKSLEDRREGVLLAIKEAKEWADIHIDAISANSLEDMNNLTDEATMELQSILSNKMKSVGSEKLDSSKSSSKVLVPTFCYV